MHYFSRTILGVLALVFFLTSCNEKSLFELLTNSKNEDVYDCRADIENAMAGGEDLVDTQDQQVPIGELWESCSVEKNIFCIQGTSKEDIPYSFGFLGPQRRSYGFPAERIRGSIGNLSVDLAVVYNSWKEISSGVWSIEYYAQDIFVDLVWDANSGKIVSSTSAGHFDDGVSDYTSNYQGVFGEKGFTFALAGDGRTGVLTMDGTTSTLYLYDSTSYNPLSKTRPIEGKYSYVSTLDQVEARCSDGFRLELTRNFAEKAASPDKIYEANLNRRFTFEWSEEDEPGSY